MKLVWHIFLKDLRRLWLLLLPWGAIIVAQYAAWRALSTNTAVGLGFGASNSSMALVLWVLHLVAGWLLVPLLIQEDNVVAEAPAWRTRPISGLRLLAAKVLGGYLLLCLWPSLFTIPWWREAGFGWAHVGLAVVYNSLGMVMVLTIAAWVAVLTDTFARFIGWSLIAIVAIALGGLMLATGMTLAAHGLANIPVLTTRAAIAMGVLWTTALVVIPLQYLRCRKKLVWSLIGGAVAVVGLVVQLWPWSFAQMQSWTGLQNYSLPTTVARPGPATLFMPPGAAKGKTGVRLRFEFETQQLAPTDVTWWSKVAPRWRFGANRWSEGSQPLGDFPSFDERSRELAGVAPVKKDRTERGEFAQELAAQLGTRLRNGEGVISTRNEGDLWRGQKGFSLVLHADRGTDATDGLRLLHVQGLNAAETVAPGPSLSGYNLWWIESEPLFTPSALLTVLNPNAGGGPEIQVGVVAEGPATAVSQWIRLHYESYGMLIARWIPVGVMGLTMREASFERGRWREPEYTGKPEPAPLREGATLTLTRFEQAMPLRVDLPETAFVPDIVVEASLEDALRRARAEDKLVLVHLLSKPVGDRAGDSRRLVIPLRDRDLVASRFICVELAAEEASALRKPFDEPGGSLLVFLRPDGTEQDRTRVVAAAIRANAEGKTYASVLSAQLPAITEDRRLRYNLHDALRMRGELAGAFDAVMWIVDHAPAPFEGTDLFEIGRRIQHVVTVYPPAMEALRERRDLALANLRRDPRDVGAARMLCAITFGLQHDRTIWLEFPRVMPRENPLWWEYIRNWVNRTVADKKYGEAVAAVDLEKFYAEGPAWVRSQLLQKRSLVPGGEPAGVVVWQRQLVRTGLNCVDALANGGQPEAALRVGQAVLRVDSSRATLFSVSNTLISAGAKAQANRLRKGMYAP